MGFPLCSGRLQDMSLLASPSQFMRLHVITGDSAKYWNGGAVLQFADAPSFGLKYREDDRQFVGEPVEIYACFWEGFPQESTSRIE
jgi:hypothetical protein